MKLKRRGFLGSFNRFRLMLTLGLAVVLPAAALIYVNFSQLRAFERDKVLEAAIHRDFQEMLAITEKKINKKAYAMSEDVRNLFPSPDTEAQEKKSNSVSSWKRIRGCRTCFSSTKKFPVPFATSTDG